ncbi:hypothetical protein JB92DRAFT_3037363 [Gautieria morchelliformis]|nr:hypothetical protein JB92DRAFT_3037363 [Gautieria morchelliformis]
MLSRSPMVHVCARCVTSSLVCTFTTVLAASGMYCRQRRYTEAQSFADCKLRIRTGLRLSCEIEQFLEHHLCFGIAMKEILLLTQFEN